jgi:hypothetical protein
MRITAPTKEPAVSTMEALRRLELMAAEVSDGRRLTADEEARLARVVRDLARLGSADGPARGK